MAEDKEAEDKTTDESIKFAKFLLNGDYTVEFVLHFENIHLK